MEGHAPPASNPPVPLRRRGGTRVLALLLAINLFNYIDRYVLVAVEPEIRKNYFGGESEDARAQTGLLATAFLVSYMIASPVFGRLADRFARWPLVGLSVVAWSLATGASGLAATFTILLIMRMFVGIGEAGYGPSAPTIIADVYPPERRASVMAWFYMAISVGSALGYAIGGFVAEHWHWRAAFLVVVPPGLLLGLLCFFMREPQRGAADAAEPAARAARWRDYIIVLKTPSYVLDTAGMIALTFAIGGISFWMPDYLTYRGVPLGQGNFIFGLIAAVAGVTATLAGGIAGDRLRGRIRGAYFAVSAAGIWISCPMVLLVLWTPFPWAWGVMFVAMFFLFFNTGPSNAILANVTHPSMRATAFALNIFVIHLLGDAISPPVLGKIIGPVVHEGGRHYRYDLAFATVSAIMAVAGALWFAGRWYLDRDTELAPRRLPPVAAEASVAGA